MEKIKTFRDLKIWQKAVKFVTQIYQKTRDFPKEEIYSLTSQIRRSAILIPSNIAEGYGRNSTNDYIRFLQISQSSLYENQTQLEISYNLGYFQRSEFSEIYELSREIERMLSSLIKKVKQSESK